MNQALNRAIDGLYRLEDYAAGTTLLHRVHPMAKLLVTLGYLAAVVSFPRTNLSGLIPFLSYPVIFAVLGEVPFKLLGKRLLPALPFILPLALSEWLLDRTPLFSVGTFAVTGGMISALVLCCKTLLTVSAVLLLAATTRLQDLSAALAAAHCPPFFIQQLNLTYRYLSVLAGEVGRMLSAYHLRAPKVKGIAMRDMGSFVGQLLLRSFDRAARVYQAMKCRGFSGALTAGVKQSFATKDGVYAGLLLLAIAALRCLPIAVWIGQLAGGS